VAGYSAWQVLPAVAGSLEQLGWGADEPGVVASVPAVARGSNVVVVAPPSPAWAGPIFGALIGRPSAAGGPVLVLAAPALVAEVALMVGALVEGSDLQVEVARAVHPAQAPFAPSCDVLIASPDTALDRHSRSALRPEKFRAIVFAWPETWHADDAIASLLQDFPRDAQRVVLTASADQVDGPDGVAERYARKALVVHAAAPVAPASSARSGSVHTVASPWSSRACTVGTVIDSIGPAVLTIWTADRRDHQLIRRSLGGLRRDIQLANKNVPASGAILCYDLPSASQLLQMTAAGNVILLVPPGTERHAARIAPGSVPLPLASPATAAADRDTALRAQVAAVIATGDDVGALYALAPLFEQCDPQRVAAALFGLWQGTLVVPDAPAPSRLASQAADTGGIAKIWIGAGKKDEATVGDFVAVLIKEAGMERAKIGRIELRDTFALVEVPAADAEGIVQRLTGMTIRKRKLSARVDRGRGGGAGRGERNRS
jgi:ATP-dependent RNA helicase DeaD